MGYDVAVPVFIALIAVPSFLGAVVVMVRTKPARFGSRPPEEILASCRWIYRENVHVSWDGRIFDPFLYEVLIAEGAVGVVPRARTRDRVAAFIRSRYPEWWFMPSDVSVSLEDPPPVLGVPRRPSVLIRYAEGVNVHHLKIGPPDRSAFMRAIEDAQRPAG